MLTVCFGIKHNEIEVVLGLPSLGFSVTQEALTLLVTLKPVTKEASFTLSRSTQSLNVCETAQQFILRLSAVLRKSADEGNTYDISEASLVPGLTARFAMGPYLSSPARKSLSKMPQRKEQTMCHLPM